MVNSLVRLGNALTGSSFPVYRSVSLNITYSFIYLVFPRLPDVSAILFKCMYVLFVYSYDKGVDYV